MPKMHIQPPSLQHALAIAASIALWSPAARSQSAETPKPVDAPTAVAATNQLDRVEITGRHYDNAIGSSDAASQGTIRVGAGRKLSHF